jgi:hypothetical protein
MLVQRGSSLATAKRPSAATARSVVVRAVAEPTTTGKAAPKAAKRNGNGAAKQPEHFINVIPQTAWEKGIPPVMVRTRRAEQAANDSGLVDVHNTRAVAAACACACRSITHSAPARPRQGSHLMASGVIAPVSTSKGAGVGVDVHQFQYPGEANTQVGCACSKACVSTYVRCTCAVWFRC